MTPKIIKYPTIERQEIKGLDLDIIRKRGSAKTYSGMLIAKIKESRDKGNIETAKFLEALYNLYKEYHPKNINKVEILDGWKGKDNIEVFRNFEEDFTIITHQKDKEGEVMKVTKQVSKNDVNRILNYILTWKIEEQHKCYDFSNILGETNWQEVWKKRTEVYFNKYYYPIKVLEALGIIKYSGKGVVTRLRCLGQCN